MIVTGLLFYETRHRVAWLLEADISEESAVPIFRREDFSETSVYMLSKYSPIE